MIGPMSGEHYASFLFYKPGYGSDPVVPRWLTTTSEELFFSKAIGVTGVLEGSSLLYGKNSMIKVTFGIVETTKTKDERRTIERNAKPTN